MAFLPTDISGLAAWYDAGDAASVTGATPVTQWNDKSGNDRHLAHATAGPDYVTALQLMRFNGPASAGAVGDYLNLPSMTIRTVFAFIKAITPQTTANRYHCLFGSAANDVALYLDIPGGTTADYGIRPKGGLHKVALNAEGWISQTTVDATVKRPVATSGDMIAVEYATGVTTNSYFGGSGTNGGGPDWRPNWDLAEVIVFDRVLTANEKQQVEGYLAHKWGRADLLPAAHPYKAVAPGSVAGLNIQSTVHAHGVTGPTLIAGSGISLNDIAAHRIFQRVGTTATILLSGGYTGAAPADVQARVMQEAVVVKDWAALTGTVIDGGNWSGTLPAVPQGGMYRVEVRTRTGGGDVLAIVAGVNEWGVGDIYGLIGSSSAERWFTIGAGYSPDTRLKVYDGGWRAATSMGAAAVTFGNQAIADSGVPVAILDYGVGGTKLNQWVQSVNASYVAFRNALAVVGPVKAVIVVAGMNDARAGEIASQSGHAANWRTLIGRIRTDAGNANLPILIWGAQRCLQAGMNDLQFAHMRNAEHAVAQDANVTLAVTTLDLGLIADNLHLTEAGMVTAAARLARTAGALFYGTGQQWRQPEVLGARRVDDTYSDVTIAHHGGTDLTPVSGITGFQISTNDFASVLTISDAVRQSANVIRLSHASTGGTAARLRYQYGAAPDVSGAVKDNSAIALPLAPTLTGLAVFSGVVLAPLNTLHLVHGDAPVLGATVPAAMIAPMNTRHFWGGQAAMLFTGTSGSIGNRRQTMRVLGEARALAVTAD